MTQNENAEVKKEKTGVFGFFRGVFTELKKVVWPTKREMVNYTAVVFVAVAFVCTLIWVCDFVFARIFNFILG